MKNNRGFTLIEIVIVAIAMSVGSTLVKAPLQSFAIMIRGMEAMKNVRQLSDSVWMYKVESGKFPETDDPSKLPENLDFKLSSNPTKYFTYGYITYDSGALPARETVYGCVLAMYNTPNYVAPPGAVVGYKIFYAYDTPEAGVSGNGRPLTDKWYKFYSCYVQGADGSPVEKAGWPLGL